MVDESVEKKYKKKDNGEKEPSVFDCVRVMHGCLEKEWSYKDFYDAAEEEEEECDDHKE